MDNFLEAKAVSHRYADGKRVLREINLAVPERAFVALVGASGIGKTTLLKILGGLVRPSAGTVRIDGRSPYRADHTIGIVFQRDNLMPWRTVAQNVALPLELEGMDKKTARARVAELLSLVGLTDAADKYPSRLSGGMAQRVALARGLVHRPDVLLLDEPFGALDALTRERMGAELLRIWRVMPVTVVMVTHSIHEAVFLADQVLVLNGRAAPAGGPATISARIGIPLVRPRRFEVQATPAFMQCVTMVRQAIGPMGGWDTAVGGGADDVSETDPGKVALQST